MKGMRSRKESGDEITLMAEGPDEEEALKAVSESFRKALQD